MFKDLGSKLPNSTYIKEINVSNIFELLLLTLYEATSRFLLLKSDNCIQVLKQIHKSVTF